MKVLFRSIISEGLCFTIWIIYGIFNQNLIIYYQLFNRVYRMNRKIWIKKTGSFSEAQDQDLQYYMNMTPQERIETVQFLREQYFKFNGSISDESGKGLRRTVRVIQQA
jgi:hypothetical protein